MKQLLSLGIALLVMAGAGTAWADGPEGKAVAKKDVTGETISAPGGVVVEILGRHNVTIQLANKDKARSYGVCFGPPNGNWGQPGATCPKKSGPRSWANAPARRGWRMP